MVADIELFESRNPTQDFCLCISNEYEFLISNSHHLLNVLFIILDDSLMSEFRVF